MTLRTISIAFAFAAAGLFLGCTGAHDHDPEGEAHQHNEAAEEADGHDHGDAHAGGAHGGHVYVLGGDAAHAEMTHSDGKVAVWLTTHEGDSLDAGDSMTLQLFSDGKFVDFTLKKTAVGAYELADKTACDLLDRKEGLKGRLHATIDGEKITGVLEHHAHD